MTIPDTAIHIYNHNFRLDPIMRGVLDPDFYISDAAMIRNVHPKAWFTLCPSGLTRPNEWVAKERDGGSRCGGGCNAEEAAEDKLKGSKTDLL